jgi:glycosyltransferase involved in cell wall biosynthesis
MPALPPLRILHPSHGAPQKNIPLLIRAVGHLPAELEPTLTLTFDAGVGGGVLAAEARRWAPGRVEFRGPVPRSQLAALYADHHLLAFPSTVESLGIPLLEALSASRPIVVSDLDWAREACGPYAVYAPPGNVGAWRDAIGSLVESGRLASAPPVPQAWLSRFTWDTASQRYAELLCTLP